MKNNLFTSESVLEGHPDKMCDAISDALLDAYLSVDKYARVAIETCASKNNVMVMGEVSSKKEIDIESIVRNKIIEIGYNNDELLFNGNNVNIIIDISKQSENISSCVNKTKEKDLGAGDQGIMFGYASDEIDGVFMPAAIYYAHLIARRLSHVRKTDDFGLRPDGKTQVTCAYDNGKLTSIDTIVVSIQHKENVNNEELKKYIIENVIKPVIPAELLTKETKYIINPSGCFIIGGPAADTGLTGRKIIVDTYGGYAPHGGGAFSGKDPTKVDRSASYYARYVAKNLVANKICKKCLIEVSYAIGLSYPISINVNTFNTGKYDDEKILEIINSNFDFRPSNIIKELNLYRPIYSKTSSYGHFGNNDYPWEKIKTLKY